MKSQDLQLLVGLRWWKLVSDNLNITYVVSALRGMPEVFDWDDDEDF